MKLNTRKILFIFSILIILLIAIKLCPKYDSFESKLSNPKVLRVEKEGTNAVVEWYDHNTNVHDYVILYVDVQKLASGVWVQTKVKCHTKRCKVVIKNLAGEKYKLAVLSRVGENLSELEPTDIITFTDEEPYEGLAVHPVADSPSTGDNEPLPELEHKNQEESTDNNNPAPSENDNEDKISNPSPSPAPNPQLDCSNGYVKLTNIKNKDDLDMAEVVPECQDLENLSRYMKKPFYHNWLDKIF